jgi:hypothetical protein
LLTRRALQGASSSANIIYASRTHSQVRARMCITMSAPGLLAARVLWYT